MVYGSLFNQLNVDKTTIAGLNVLETNNINKTPMTREQWEDILRNGLDAGGEP